MGTQAVTASHDATIQFRSVTKRTGTNQYRILNVWLMPCAFTSTLKPMTRSKNCSVQCALSCLTTMVGKKGESSVHYSPETLNWTMHSASVLCAT